MNPEFWQDRWQDGRIGFNQSKVNPLLTTYFSRLNLPIGSRIFVPLCGKSIDMVWLARQGYDVVGAELVESAVQDFFDEHNITPTIDRYEKITRYQGHINDNVMTLWVADIFDLTANDIGQIDGVYDRAALIALPADMRPKYSEQVCQLTHQAPQLLLTLHYNQDEWSGPPFAVSPDHVRQYYHAHYQITELESKAATLNANPDMTATEHVWMLRK